MSFNLKKVISLLISLSLILSLLACGKSEGKEEEKEKILSYKGAVNAPIDEESKWINSSIYGSIDSSLNISEKDDFYTAVNKEWLLSRKAPTKDVQEENVFTSTMDKTKERLINIISQKHDPESLDSISINISDEEIAHDLDLVMSFAGEASDWDKRNKAGSEPLRAYIKAIENISDMEDMSRYITDFQGDNLSLEYLFEIVTISGITDADTFQTVIIPTEKYSLYSIKPYMDMDLSGRLIKRKLESVVNKVLSDLGYTEDEISLIIQNCYKFEGMMADHTSIILSNSLDSYKKGYSLDELETKAGSFPIRKIIEGLGYSIKDDFRLGDPGFLKFLGRAYNENNLELLKAYYMVHTINSAAALLDRDAYDAITSLNADANKKNGVSTVPDGEGDKSEEEIRDEWDLVLEAYLRKYLAGPMDIVYVSRYCSNTQKQEIEELVDKVIYNYHDVIDEVNWLTDSAKIAAKEKLEHITVRVLYPDDFDSYLDLNFEKDDDLVKMVQKINLYQARNNAKKAGTGYNKKLWNLDQVSTSVSNAYYMPKDNSINILAGIISTGDVFDDKKEDEINMACIGTIIGHEISHAFDSTGCYYDKNGNQKRWWDINDLAQFQLFVGDINNYYYTITPYPGASVLTNTRYSGETIADMGGMRIMLKIAEEMPEFDYDLFFKSYAMLWRHSCSFGAELSYIESDVHPLAFLRTNVTLSQFDEFLDTYNISSKDGMYLEKEKRIKIW